MFAFWALLPITLFLMGVWGFLKPYLKVYGKEEYKRYFVMSFLCAGVLYLAILFDKTNFAREIIPKITFGQLDYAVVRIFVYPAMLYAITLVWDFFDKSKKKKR
jgi:hypothetical protein